MATTIATISLTSTDLLSSALAFSQTNPLNTAGSATGLTLTSGLARTTTSYSGSGVIESTTLYRSNDATDNGANKVYLKNMSATAAEFYTVFIDQEEMGRLYAGDWAFFPWSAKSGTKENFVMTVGGTWVAGETLEFDGVLTTAANTTVADIATQVDNQHFPNWTTTISGAAVTFTARHSMDAGTVVTATADMVIVQTGGSDATAVVSAAAMGTATDSDIMIIPSVHTTMTLEHMLFNE
tara:strand:- start:33 stop:749 length:717 start_codon:yes stop_codon:yes gene_type:complete